MGGFLFGFDASVISGVISFVVPEFGLNDWQQGLVVSAPTLAAVFAALAVGPLSDYLGRKKMLLVISFLYVISAVLSAVAPGFMFLVIARAIGGLAFGSLVLAPMYIAEISPAKSRGLMVSVNQLNIMVGFSAAYFANYFLLKASGSGAGWVVTLGIDQYAWRWMLGLEALPAITYFLLLFTIPESPRWLIVKKRIDEAKLILARLVPSERLEAELKTIQGSVLGAAKQAKSAFSELFSSRLRMALLVAIIVGVAQQITGINAVYFYAPSIFEQSGVGTDAAFAQAVWIGIINLVFTVIAMVLIDKLGRKPLLVIGLSGVPVSMSLSAYGFNQATYRLTEGSVMALSDKMDKSKLDGIIGKAFDNDVAFKNALKDSLGELEMKAHEVSLIQAAIDMNPTIVLVGILGFVASFAVSLGPVMWVLFSEIFPNRIRGLAISTVGFINGLVSFIVQFLFPWELSNFGTASTFFIYGLFALVGLVLVSWLLPETKGKSLEQIEQDCSAT
ncbi:MFS transporter [bacterium]|nr:MFS transporter [bacterium]